MKLALIAALIALPALLSAGPPARPFPQFELVDECGGLPTFLGSNYMVETASGFCGASALSVSVTVGSSPVLHAKITLPMNQENYGILQNDIVVVKGTGTCLDGLTLTVSSTSGNPLTANTTCSAFSTPASGTLNGAYLNGGSPRYQMRLLSEVTSWAPSGFTISYLTASNLGVPTSCSMGNPGGYTDGTDFYLAFLVQDTTIASCVAASSPGNGLGYDTWGCNLTSSGAPSASNFIPSHCNVVKTVYATANGAMLDPHIHNGNIYVSERNNPTVLAALNDLTTMRYNAWSIDYIQISWGSSPSVVTRKFYVFDDAAWNTLPAGNSRASNGCEEYYKLTGFVDLPNSLVRVFFQSNDIKTNVGGSLQNPYAYGGVNVQPWGTMSSVCDGLGAGNYSDAFAFSGIFYSDLGTATYTGTGGTGSIGLGSNYTQLYPPVSSACLTAAKNIACYGEFPWVFKDGVRMMFEGNRFTSSIAVDQCDTLMLTPRCQPNYSDEWLQNQIFTDFSQSTYPMTLIASQPATNFNVSGTFDCGAILYDQTMGMPASAYCGLFDSPHWTFGGCSRMDIDEASQTVACADQTNKTEPLNLTSPLQRTMVWSYTGAALNGAPSNPTGLFNQAVEVLGGISITGNGALPNSGTGIAIAAQ